MASVRTFIALETPSEIRSAIGGLQSELMQSHADVRWEPSEKFHATIKFLGNIEEGKLESVISVIKQSCSRSPRFNVRYAGTGVFPDHRHPRVVWVGCENNDGVLGELKTVLDRSLSPLGFPVEQRAFHPHITLGRVRSERGIRNLLSSMESLTFEPRSARVDCIVVMKSTLRPQGSEYSQLATIPLRSIS